MQQKWSRRGDNICISNCNYFIYLSHYVVFIGRQEKLLKTFDQLWHINFVFHLFTYPFGWLFFCFNYNLIAINSIIFENFWKNISSSIKSASFSIQVEFPLIMSLHAFVQQAAFNWWPSLQAGQGRAGHGRVTICHLAGNIDCTHTHTHRHTHVISLIF